MRSLTVLRVRARFATHSSPVPASARTRVAGDGHGIQPVSFTTTTVVVAITGAPVCARAPCVPPRSRVRRRGSEVRIEEAGSGRGPSGWSRCCQ